MEKKSSIGTFIKTFAGFFGICGCIGALFGGIALISDDVIGIGVAVLVGGILVVLSGMSIMYGFGQLVENSDFVVNHIKSTSNGAYQNQVNQNAMDRAQRERIEQQRFENNQRIQNAYSNAQNYAQPARRYCTNCGAVMKSNVCEMCGYVERN